MQQVGHRWAVVGDDSSGGGNDRRAESVSVLGNSVDRTQGSIGDHRQPLCMVVLRAGVRRLRSTPVIVPLLADA